MLSEAGWISAVPKVELHVHLEGAIRPDTVWRLFQRHGNRMYRRREAVTALFQHRDLNEFFEHFKYVHSWLKDADAYGQLTAELGADLASQQVRYAEVTVAPAGAWYFNGLDPEALLEAVHDGAAQVLRDHGTVLAFLLDPIRNMGVDHAERTVDLAQSARQLGVIGLNLAGDERRYPAAPFAAAFRRARALGLRTAAHAGEGCPSESIATCVDDLGVERIGHGLSLNGDSELTARLARLGMGVECCPSSNIATGLVSSYASHPAGLLLRRGVRVSLHTDDPTFFRTTLTEEYERTQAALGLSDSEVLQMLVNAVETSFLPPDVMASLRDHLYGAFRCRGGQRGGNAEGITGG